jgi:hypothetical protein
MECIPDQHQQELALSRLQVIEGMAITNTKSYPVEYVLKYIIAGQYKRMLLPAPTQKS